MELKDAKRVSIAVLLLSNLLMIFIAMCLHRLLIRRSAHIITITQHIISCITSGILLGTFLMIILPNSINIISHKWHNTNIGYMLIGIGFFLICIIQELINVYESYASNKQAKTEKEQLINPLNQLNQDNQVTRMISLVFALGVHYFFSGILIGGQTQDTTTLWILVGAICLHMALVAFSTTLCLLIDSGKQIQVFIAMLIWSIMGPLGVLVSILIDSDTSQLNTANGILQCLSAGTFVYITFIDMLHDDLMKKELYAFINIILIFVGFFIMVAINLFHNHAH